MGTRVCAGVVGMLVLACGDSELGGGAPATGGGASSIEGGAPSVGGQGDSAGGAALDGGANEGGADVHWGCLGEVMWPELETTTMIAKLQFFDEDDPTFLLAGATVKACPRDDLACEGVDSVIADAQGRVELVLTVARDSPGWDGYFEVDGGADYPINLIATVRPYTNDPQIEFGVVNNDRLVGGAVVLTGDLPQAERGHIALVTYECTDQVTGGISIGVVPPDGSTVGYINEQGLPDASLTESNADGLALAANVVQGYATVTANRALTSELVGTTTVPVRAGSITTFGLIPTP